MTGFGQAAAVPRNWWVLGWQASSIWNATKSAAGPVTRNCGPSTKWGNCLVCCVPIIRQDLPEELREPLSFPPYLLACWSTVVTQRLRMFPRVQSSLDWSIEQCNRPSHKQLGVYLIVHWFIRPFAILGPLALRVVRVPLHPTADVSRTLLKSDGHNVNNGEVGYRVIGNCTSAPSVA